MNLLKKLKSNEFALTVAILSVLVQSFHSYSVFYSVSSLRGTGWGIIQAVLFAAVFDLAILFYTVRNNTRVVLGASVFMALFNMYYYYVQPELSTLQLIFGLVLSIVIPMTQYYYAEEIQEDEYPGQGTAELQIAIEVAESNAKIWKQKHDAMFAELQDTVREYKKDTEKFRRHNSVQTEELGRLTAELRKAQGQPINPAAEAAELEDRTLMGVAKSSPGRVIATNDPI